jgi:hypothetical protein
MTVRHEDFGWLGMVLVIGAALGARAGGDAPILTVDG